jgi:hypothetical protein
MPPALGQAKQARLNLLFRSQAAAREDGCPVWPEVSCHAPVLVA